VFLPILERFNAPGQVRPACGGGSWSVPGASLCAWPAAPVPNPGARWFAPSLGSGRQWGAALTSLRECAAPISGARFGRLFFGLAWSGNERFGFVQTAPDFHSHIIVIQVSFFGNLGVIQPKYKMFPQVIVAFRL